MFNIIKNLFKPLNKVPISIYSDKLNVITTIKDDSYHNIKSGIKNYKCKTPNNDYIGEINFRHTNGQIGILVIDEKYRNLTIGTQLLKKAREDIIKNGTAKEIWAVTSKEHQYWSNIPGMKWREPAYKTVTGSGYYVNINDSNFIKFLDRKTDKNNIYNI